jgi:hypothetical protein
LSGKPAACETQPELIDVRQRPLDQAVEGGDRAVLPIAPQALGGLVLLIRPRRARRRVQPLEPASQPALVLLKEHEPHQADQRDDQQAAAEYRGGQEVGIAGDLPPKRAHAIIACCRARSRPK